MNVLLSQSLTSLCIFNQPEFAQRRKRSCNFFASPKSRLNKVKKGKILNFIEGVSNSNQSKSASDCFAGEKMDKCIKSKFYWALFALERFFPSFIVFCQRINKTFFNGLLRNTHTKRSSAGNLCLKCNRRGLKSLFKS